MFKILKKFYFNRYDFFFLKKKNRKVLYTTSLRINLYWKIKKYIYYSGRRYLYVYIKPLCIDTKVSQFIFNRKPFSGPIKKFKI